MPLSAAARFRVLALAVTVTGSVMLAAPLPAAVAATPLTISATSTATQFPDPTAGGTLPQIHGRILDDTGAGVPGLAVSLAFTDADHSTPVADGASDTTAADGSFALQPSAPVRGGPLGIYESRTYTVVHADGDGGYPAAVSGPIHLGVPAFFYQLVNSGSTATPHNPSWAIQGGVSGPVGSVIAGQVQTPTGWRTVSTTTSYAYGTTGVNRFSVPLPGLASGSQTVRAVRLADVYQDEVDSPAVTVTYTWGQLAGNPSRYSFAYTVPSTSAAGRPAARQPVRFSPCTPITWAINLAGAPHGALALVEQAFVQAGYYSGYHFRYVGTTSEKPGTRDADQRASSGKGPAILVKWVRSSGETDLARNLKNVAGVGGSVVLHTPGTAPQLAGGTLLLVQNPGGVDLPMDFGPFSWGPEVLHEIGSVVGLRPVPDTHQIMFSKVGKATRYGAGDVAGLAKLGKTPGC